MKAIMYHYVREYDPEVPNFTFLDVREFRRQLDYFNEQYGYVSKEEWDVFLSTGSISRISGKVILTFDDATRCHYKFVLPELLKRKLWGIFYVPTAPYSEGKLLDVHLIHLLCGTFTGGQLLDSLTRLSVDAPICAGKREVFERFTYKAQKNNPGISEFKRVMNYFLPQHYKSVLLKRIVEDLNFTYDSNQFYVKMDELLEMKNQGMVIGSHSHRHFLMSTLTAEEQEQELETSFSVLEAFSEFGQRTYCHPYGGAHSYNSDTLLILNRFGVKYSFSVENREITNLDYSSSIHNLPRFDCNYFPFGRADSG
jgi:peptidoglycan/xylan/chitin deacetylase (PgdA/CDA1 family)